MSGGEASGGRRGAARGYGASWGWLALGVALASVAAQPARAGQEVAPLHSATVTTRLRTLRGLPKKHLVTSPAAWNRLVADLEGAPPAPAFAQGEVCVVVLVDESGGARSWIEKLELREDGGLRVRVRRHDGGASVEPHLNAFFLRFPLFPGGVELVHSTVLPDGGGSIQRTFKPEPGDSDPKLLPELGPDLRFRYEVEGGGAVSGLTLRHETRFAGERLPARLETVPYVAGLALPRFRRGTQERHIYALYCESHRSENALLLESWPTLGPDGSPRPLTHTFRLQARPAGPIGPGGR